MKKIVYKLVAVSVIVLLLPFVLTLIFTKNKKVHNSLESMDYIIYYEKDGNRQKLDFDQYLIGIVAANMPTGYHIEALKAQAVISRTYALYNISMLSKDNPSRKNILPQNLDYLILVSTRWSNIGEVKIM